MLLLFKCEKCGFKKKHYFADKLDRKLACKKCGEVDLYLQQVSTFTMQVHYSTVEEIMEHEIDPSVQETLLKIGTELVNGDVATLENLVGEDKMKETFYEDDTWIDESSQ